MTMLIFQIEKFRRGACFWGLCLLLSVSVCAEVLEKATELYNEACNSLDSDHFENASSDFENAVNLDPDFFYIINENGYFLKIMKSRSKKAVLYIEKMCNGLLNKKKEDPLIFLYLGWAQLILENKEESRQNVEKAIQGFKKGGISSDMAEDLLKEAKA